MIATRNAPLAERLALLESRSTRVGACLMVPAKGYGEVRFDGDKRLGAHRAAYLVHNGPIPDGLVVRHACDNPGCIEPTHLVVGTYSDNNRDAVERQRVRMGVEHHEVKSSPEVVAAAVATYMAGGRSQAEVGRLYGVTQSTVGKWVRAELRLDGGQTGHRQGKGRSALARGGLKPCGTKAAYERHLALGETVCADCRGAHRTYMREYKARRLRGWGA